MTLWLPSLADRTGPKYLRIADAMAEDIYAGRLAVGDRLPTHRDLAWRLGVTVGTISRAYAEAERRGLVIGEVGRGSFVRVGARSASILAMPGEGGPQTIELGINRPPARLAAAEFADGLADLAQAADLADLINYQAYAGKWEHRVAGAAWIARRGVEAPTERVLVTSGAEHAIAAALTGLADPGDEVLVEEFTWSGTRALAGLLRLTLKPVAMDGEGLIPEAFEAACHNSTARLVYLQSTVHNPTGAVMSAGRREAIVAIARAHGLIIIEDDVYGFLAEDAPPALAAFAPERSLYITAVSKSVAPGLRVGFVAVPAELIARFGAAARAINWMAPPIMAELAARWIADGTAAVLAERIRKEALARQGLAARLLQGFAYGAAPASFHIWLELPEPWRAQEAVTAARAQGVSLCATEMFVPGRGETPHRIRITLTATHDHAELERGLSILTQLLRRQPEPCLAVA